MAVLLFEMQGEMNVTCCFPLFFEMQGEMNVTCCFPLFFEMQGEMNVTCCFPLFFTLSCIRFSVKFLTNVFLVKYWM